jgi:DNA topoisomerase-1
MPRVNGTAGSRRKQRVSYKEESSDDDAPLASQTTSNQLTPISKPPRKKAKIAPAKVEDSESEDDLPLSSTMSSPQKLPSTAVDSTDEEADDGVESDAPSTPVKKGRKNAPVKAPKKVAPTKRKAKEMKNESDEDTPLATPTATPRKKPSKKGKEKEVKPEGSPRKRAKKEEEDEDLYKWWENANDQEGEGVAEIKEDGSVKWNTLVHNGVLFPPPYEPLPSNVRFHYDGRFSQLSHCSRSLSCLGRAVDLPPESEEVAYFFAKLMGGPHVEDPIFQKNFFRDFTSVIKQFPPVRSSHHHFLLLQVLMLANF